MALITLMEAAKPLLLVALPTKRMKMTIDAVMVVDPLVEALNNRLLSPKDLKRRDTTCSTMIATPKLTSLKSTTVLTSSNISTRETNTTLGEWAAMAMEEADLLPIVMALLTAMVEVLLLLIAMEDLQTDMAPLIATVEVLLIVMEEVLSALLVLIAMELLTAMVDLLQIATVETIVTETVDHQIATETDLSIVLLLVALMTPSEAVVLLVILAALLLALVTIGHLLPPLDLMIAALDATKIATEAAVDLRLAVATSNLNNNKIAMAVLLILDALAVMETTGEDRETLEDLLEVATIATANKDPTVPHLHLLPRVAAWPT